MEDKQRTRSRHGPARSVRQQATIDKDLADNSPITARQQRQRRLEELKIKNMRSTIIPESQPPETFVEAAVPSSVDPVIDSDDDGDDLPIALQLSKPLISVAVLDVPLCFDPVIATRSRRPRSLLSEGKRHIDSDDDDDEVPIALQLSKPPKAKPDILLRLFTYAMHTMCPTQHLNGGRMKLLLPSHLFPITKARASSSIKSGLQRSITLKECTPIHKWHCGWVNYRHVDTIRKGKRYA